MLLNLVKPVNLGQFTLIIIGFRIDGANVCAALNQIKLISVALKSAPHLNVFDCAIIIVITLHRVLIMRRFYHVLRLSNWAIANLKCANDNVCTSVAGKHML